MYHRSSPHFSPVWIKRRYHDGRKYTKKISLTKVLISSIIIASMIYILVSVTLRNAVNRMSNNELNESEDSRLISSSTTSQSLSISCPSELEDYNIGKHDEAQSFYNDYNKDRIQINEISSYSDIYQIKYDSWFMTYNEKKKQKQEWKSKYIASNINSGDKIYESASGVGFNLLMTLEILSEIKELADVTVYGNDYVQESVDIANILLKKLAPVGYTVGSICKGDSTNLYHIPSNSFDLAYTGYIDPLDDGMNTGYSREDWKEICSSQDEEKIKLRNLDQKSQEDWFNLWVSELVRIVKPGKPIMVEEIASPRCIDLTDWGGVSKDWWKAAVAEYQWDVDVNSIIIEDTTDTKRYNVFMRKKVV